PPAEGYALIVCRYEKIRIASIRTMTPGIGNTSEKEASPTAGISTRRITSVAYATEDKLSEENTARAVGFPSRSCVSRAAGSARPSSSRLAAKARDVRGALS